MEHKTESKFSSYSRFETDKGSAEYFFSLRPEGYTLEECLRNLDKHYERVLKKTGLSGKTEIFRRFYLSDIANQYGVLTNSKIFRRSRQSASSVIGQRPLQGSLVAFFAYHIGDKNLHKSPLSLRGQTVGEKISGKSYDILAVASLSDGEIFDSEKQTRSVFADYDSLLGENGCSLLRNAVRTWIYVRDIDNHYGGMVKARRELFAEKGLTKDSRFIASTGIEGSSQNAKTLVSMDAISFAGLSERQIVRMEARNNMSPTHAYGVTFERGTRVDFGDRSRLYVSGTASIDKDGKVLHLGDVEKQAERAVLNIRALLAPHGAAMEDMAYLLVYVRNAADAPKVAKILKKKGCGRIPAFYLEGAVCRPEWLVEIEGEAIVKAENDWPAFI